MANGHVEIHDPFANNNVTSLNSDPTSQTASMDDSVEFRLLMVYSQRRRHPREGARELQSPGQTDTPSPQTAENDKEVKEEEKKKKKKRRGTRGILKMFSCIKPSVKNEELPEPVSDASEAAFRCAYVEPASEEETDELNEVVDRLTEIASEIPFTPPEIEVDSSGDVNVEKVVALLLREAGDKLDQEIKDANIAAEIFGNYSFFEKVMKSFLRSLGLMSSEPDHLGPHASPKTQMAVTCEATTRLLTLTSVSQRRMLGYGARYLQDYYSDWAKENGGYVEAFHNDDEEEVE